VEKERKHSVIPVSLKLDSKVGLHAEAKTESSSRIEKFSAIELGNLRTELMQSAIDSRQAADVLSSFLTGRGYAVSLQRARDAVARLEGTDRTLDGIQQELERVAQVM
jgi:hypothetical protein